MLMASRGGGRIRIKKTNAYRFKRNFERLRISINETRNRQREQTITVADLVDHYIRTELAGDQGAGGKSHATKTVYRDFLARWGSLLEAGTPSVAAANPTRRPCAKIPSRVKIQPPI
jgi:hypothetical protein